MPLETDPSRPNRNVKDPAMSLLKAAAEAAFLNGGGAISNLIDMADAMGREAETGAQAAHGFWRAVLAFAVMDVIGRNKIADLKAESGRLAEVAEQFGPVLEHSAAYDPNCLEEPTGFKPYQDLRAQFWEMIIAIRPDLTFDRDHLERQLDQGLREGIWKVWLDENSSAFRHHVNGVLDGPVAKGVERRLAWQRHYSWIDDRLSKQELFGQEGTGITLRDVYVPLRCNFHDDVPVEQDEAPGHVAPREVAGRHDRQTRRLANVGWLHETINAWLDGLLRDGEQREPRDTMRVVAGAPGSGKSVISRTIAFDIAVAGQWNVAYAELQHMAFTDEFRDRVRAYFKDSGGGAGLGDDIFDMADVDGTPPLLFVFDGLDELSHSEEAAKDVSRKFIRNVKALLSSLNRTRLRAAAIVLGRSVAVEDARKEADMTVASLLHVMPLTELDEKSLEIGSRQIGKRPSPEDCRDPLALCGNDDRDAFWERWRGAAGLAVGTEAKALSNAQLDDLTAEPLLFYLLILSGFAERDTETAADNRNIVYREIFRRVHRRDKEKSHSSSHKLEEDVFFHLMECLALAIWQGGGRTGSKRDFETFRGRHGYDRDDVFEREDFATLKNVALQFYTRAIGDTDQGYEFVHKSFGEYLAGCALLRAATELSDSNRKSRDFCLNWLELFGAQPVTPEILRFLRDQARLMPADDVKALKAGLTGHMNWGLRNGLPAHKLENITSWRMAETHQRNATGALLAVLNALAGAMTEGIKIATGKPDDPHPETAGTAHGAGPDSPSLIRLDWPDDRSARRLIEMLHITHDRATAHPRCLGWLDFSHDGRQHCLLDSLNLQETDLSGANLAGADLIGATLIRANLFRANLFRADLSGANLAGADLTGADLSEADLTGATLIRANLFRANLIGAETSSANFAGAAGFRRPECHGYHDAGSNQFRLWRRDDASAAGPDAARPLAGGGAGRGGGSRALARVAGDAPGLTPVSGVAASVFSLA